MYATKVLLYKNFSIVKNHDVLEDLTSYIDRADETSAGGPPSIVLIISRITFAGSPL